MEGQIVNILSFMKHEVSVPTAPTLPLKLLEISSRNGSGRVRINLIYESGQRAGFGLGSGCGQLSPGIDPSPLQTPATGSCMSLLTHRGFLTGHQAEPPPSAEHQASLPTYYCRLRRRASPCQEMKHPTPWPLHRDLLRAERLPSPSGRLRHPHPWYRRQPGISPLPLTQHWPLSTNPQPS